MNPCRFAVVAMALTLGVCYVLGARAIERPAQGSADHFEAAQHDIASAIAHLQAYVQGNPQGRDAPLATIQLSAMRNLVIRDDPPTPVALATYLQKVQWYVDKVARTGNSTLVTMKILGLSHDQDCQFVAFTSTPLIIIGDDREIYTMRKTPALPKAVQVSHYNIAGGSTNNDYWVFQGGRTLTLEVEFDRMPDGVAGGQIQYAKPVAGAIAARFSLTNAQQRP